MDQRAEARQPSPCGAPVTLAGAPVTSLSLLPAFDRSGVRAGVTVADVEENPQGDPSEQMRDGVRARVARLAGGAGAGARRWSPPALLGVLCAGAFAPLLTAGVGGAALVSAGIGAVTAVGGNVLTDVVKAGVQRLDEDGRPSEQELEG